MTMLEVLVAISVIAILLAITVPAVMRAREASRRAQCTAHLSGLGKAMHAYEATRQKYPAAVPASPNNPRLGADRLYAPHVYLLPYLDQAPLYNEVEAIPVPPGTALGEPSLETPGIRAIATTPIPSFLCPSDSGMSGCNYRVCLGTGPWEFDPGVAFPDFGKGAFTPLREYPTGHFPDGLSNTVAMSERLKSDEDPTYFAPREDVWFTGVIDLTGTIPPLDEMVTLCASLSVDPAEYYPHTGMTWMFGSYHHTWYNHAVTPNSRISDCSVLSLSPPPRANAGVYKASSHHPGGVNVLFMDGRVQFTSDSIDLAVWRAISTRKGEEIVALSGP